MNIAFYIDEMNLRGVANQTFLLAVNNKTILKNKSFIFYNSQNRLKNVVREEINEQSNTVCKGNNPINSPIVKIYPKEKTN